MIDTTKTITGVNVDNAPVNVVGGTLTTKSITQNGTYTAQAEGYDGYDEVTVNVSAPTPSLGTKNITQDGTYTAQADGYDGFSSVTVSTGGSGGGAGSNLLQQYINLKGDANRLFYGFSTMTDQDFTSLTDGIDWSQEVDMSEMFTGCYAMENINLIASPDSVGYMFCNCYALQNVSGFDFSNVGDMDNVFTNCTSLESINITGIWVDWDISSSTQFTANALQTIILNLGDVATDGNTATLTMGVTNLAKLSQTDIDNATAKGWTLA